MKKLLALMAVACLLQSTFAGPVDNQKIKINNSDFNYYRIVPMPDNGSLLVSRSNTNNRQIVIRLNSSNQLQWSKTFDSPDLHYFYDAGVFPDTSIYIIYGDESGYGQFYIMKLSQQGSVLWTDKFDFSDYNYQSPVTARPLEDGSLLFTPRQFYKMAAVKLNPQGAVSFSYMITIGGGVKAVGLDAEEGADKRIIIIGKEDGKPILTWFTPNDTIPHAIKYSNGHYCRPFSIIQCSDGNYVVGGLSANLGTMGEMKAWLMKLDTTGVIVWAKEYTGLIDSVKQCYIASISQIVENADHTFTTVGFGRNNLANTFSTHATIMTLSADGQPLSAYGYPVTGTIVTGSDVYPRIYKDQHGEPCISTDEYDSLSHYNQAALLAIYSASDFCKALPFNVTTGVMPSFTSTAGSNGFNIATFPVATHPVINTYDTTITITVKGLCGIFSGVEIIEEDEQPLVFPNPVNVGDLVTVQPKGFPAHEILLYDANGQLIKQVKCNTSATITLNTHGLAPGFYLLNVRDMSNKKSAVTKLLLTE